MHDPVKVGFVGAGNLASRVHYPSLDEIEATDLRAISELDEDRLTATADQYDVPGRYTNYRDMLEREDLDAVYVVMPPHLLHDIVVDCLQAGKHVFVEKPPGVSTYETEAFALVRRTAQLPDHDRLQPALHPPAAPLQGRG